METLECLCKLTFSLTTSHLAAYAVELSPAEASDVQKLALVISTAASLFTKMLDSRARTPSTTTLLSANWTTPMSSAT